MKNFKLFEDGNGQFLGFLRCMFYLFIYIYWARTDHFLAWSKVPAEFWLGQGLTQLLTPIHSELPWEFIFNTWKIFLLFSVLGFWTRYSMAIVFFLSFLLVGHAQSFGYFTRMLMPLLWAMGILTLSRAGDHFSLDALIRRHQGKKPEVLISPEYGWPVQMIRILFCLVFFSAGFSKLSTSGFAWINTDTLRNYLIRVWITHFENRHLELAALNALLFSQPFLMRLIAFFTIGLEVLAPLALFIKKLRPYLIIGLLLLQLGIKFTILVNFDMYIALYIFWLPWKAKYGEMFSILLSKTPARKLLSLQ